MCIKYLFVELPTLRVSEIILQAAWQRYTGRNLLIAAVNRS